jgi:hypothetical protein
MNLFPIIAARAYELGPRKDFAFLTIPPFVLRYAQLLLLLGDKMDWRVLLARGMWQLVSHKKNKAHSWKQDALVDLWDMTPQFESELSGTDRSSVAAIQNVEKRSLDGLGQGGCCYGRFCWVGEAVLIVGPKTLLLQISSFDQRDMALARE